MRLNAGTRRRWRSGGMNAGGGAALSPVNVDVSGNGNSYGLAGVTGPTTYEIPNTGGVVLSLYYAGGWRVKLHDTGYDPAVDFVFDGGGEADAITLGEYAFVSQTPDPGVPNEYVCVVSAA